jgi:UrcA family protein
MAATVLTSLCLAQPAVGDAPERWRGNSAARAIKLSELNLSSAAGTERLYREIVAAAKGVCGWSSQRDRGVAGNKHEREHMQPCIDAAVNDALEQVAKATGFDLERVAALHRSEVGLRGAL